MNANDLVQSNRGTSISQAFSDLAEQHCQQNQAMERVHRFGQQREVTIHRFLVKNSIESAKSLSCLNINWACNTEKEIITETRWWLCKNAKQLVSFLCCTCFRHTQNVLASELFFVTPFSKSLMPDLRIARPPKLISMSFLVWSPRNLSGLPIYCLSTGLEDI